MYKGKDPRRNGSGALDPTAYSAINSLDLEERRVKKLISTIRTICDLSGYYIENRIVLVDKSNGREWR